MNTFYAKKPLIIAHRGASAVAPENTLAAFRAAVEAGADGIEMDVMRCHSGELMVVHDDTVDRTTDGSGLVRTISKDSLRMLDAGSWFGPEHAGQRIPTLDDVLPFVEGGIRLNIEIKSQGLRSEGLEEEIADMIRAREYEDRILISSFNPLVLMRLRNVAPEIQRGLLYTPGSLRSSPRIWRHLVQPQALHPHHSVVDEEYIRWAKENGYRVNVWTVNEAERMREMIALDVDGIITDHPARLRRFLYS
ncbi:MAG: glycerophosphodiester phosphodiesterase [Anaerolineales bacterium]